MVDVPGAAPVYTPVPGITVATVVLPLLHVPPEAASANDAGDPVHTEVGPVTGDNAFTVTTVVVVHPAPTV